MGVVVDVTVVGHAGGLNAVLVSRSPGAVAVATGRTGLRRLDPADAWLPAAAIGLAALVALRADPWLVTADVLLASALAGAAWRPSPAPASRAASCPPCSALRARSSPRPSPGRSMSSVPCDPAPPSHRRSPPTRPPPDLRDRMRPWVPVFRGLLLAAPIVLVFALLFASADAVFAALARSALTLPVEIDFDDLAERAIVVTAVAWVAAGLLALAAGRLPLLVPGGQPDGRAARPSPALPTDGPPPRLVEARSLGAASAADMRQPLRSAQSRPRRSCSLSTRCSRPSWCCSSPTCSAAVTRWRSRG